MPLVKINCLKIWDNLSPLGLSPDDIFIQLTEQPLCNWGIGGKIKTMK
jgi:phenylpyruvate tautomerase PptA (4-oxalocrotonate tautomerase family)